MATTSLKLSDQLKQRTLDLARQQGVSPHAFMVQAIEQAATAAELRASFLQSAQAARADMLETGLGYDVAEVHAYLGARITNKNAPKPEAKTWQS